MRSTWCIHAIDSSDTHASTSYISYEVFGHHHSRKKVTRKDHNILYYVKQSTDIEDYCRECQLRFCGRQVHRTAHYACP